GRPKRYGGGDEPRRRRWGASGRPGGDPGDPLPGCAGAGRRGARPGPAGRTGPRAGPRALAWRVGDTGAWLGMGLRHRLPDAKTAVLYPSAAGRPAMVQQLRPAVPGAGDRDRWPAAPRV